METCPGEGVLKEKFPNTRRPSHWRVCGEFRHFRGQHNQEEKINTSNPQIMGLTTTSRGEVAQTLASATSKWGLNREVRAAPLRVRTPGLNTLRAI